MQFNMPKDVVVPDLAEWYQHRGFTALIFDTYGIGASDGEPRHDVSRPGIYMRRLCRPASADLQLSWQSDMQRRIDDFVDSVTWLSQNPLVDPEKIAVWGLCFDGNIMLATAASDRRIAAVVAVAPMIDVTGDPERREAILELWLADRAGQLAGEEPVYLPLVDEDGVTPLNQFLGNFFTTMDNMKMPIENRVTAHTYMRCLNWNILHLLPKISPTPVIMVTPELDQVFPAERQKEAFDMLGEPKEHHVIFKKNHFDWMFGDMDNVFNKQLNFLKKHMQL